MKEKVFCIGFHKSGTSSIGKALKILGYKVMAGHSISDQNVSENAMIKSIELVKKYDAFEDNPWPILYKELDKKFPGSKFILTVRDSDSWIKSQVKHFGEEITPMREWIYGVGSPKGNEQVYLNRYEQHNKEVREYFKNRPDDFVEINFSSKENNWEKICKLLNKKLPKVNFPHTNSQKDREKSNKGLRKIKNKIIGLFK